MTDKILVINPNSTEEVTRAMDAALDPLRNGIEIESVTNPDGPPGIESQGDVDFVAGHVRSMVTARDNDASAFVVACFSDPGLQAAREVTGKPVFGISECGMLTAMGLGQGVGVIAILSKSIPRHTRYFRGLGLDTRITGERPLELGVVELSDEGKTYGRMVEVATALRDKDGADVIVMGCAGMARYRARLEDEISLPVVDPTQAATAMAISAVRLGFKGKGG